MLVRGDGMFMRPLGEFVRGQVVAFAVCRSGGGMSVRRKIM